MTRSRNDEHSTQFGLWLREQQEIDSALGFVATNLDYIWSNYKTGKWMLLEEKRYNSKMTFSQESQFRVADNSVRSNRDYKGFHLIVFEKTSPNDGDIFINNKKVDCKDLIEFLQFKKLDSWYVGYFK